MAHEQSPPSPDFDVIIIGAGLSGLYQLYCLRNLGISVRVVESGSGVGGTWYWNRYPGARFDSESYSYGFSFSQEVLDEWYWKEHFAPQPETEKYCNFIADKFDLRRDIQFESRVTAAQYDDNERCWTLTLENGNKQHARFLITAIGPLSTPTMPRYEGVDTFKGPSFHTARWPNDVKSFEGKRVAVLGTGATGVQTIQEVVKTAKQLTVFQRTPNWCVPLHNRTIDEEEMARIREDYPKIFQRCRETWACFMHTADPRSVFEVTPEEREAFFEMLYASPGFGMWQGNFRDVLSDQAANDLCSNFVARKIRERVHDPKTAEKLIPKDHGFGTRRVPLETKYYEVYNQPHVRLVDIKETPITRVTETGLETTAEKFDFDIIIYATGFDAVVGSFNQIDIRNVTTGLTLKERWGGRGLRPETYLGLMVDGFPNFGMVLGPHTALGNIPRSVEYAVDWLTDMFEFLKEHGYTRFEARPEFAREWTDHVINIGMNTLSSKVDSWMTGVNRNVEGKTERYVSRYAGSNVEFRNLCDKVRDGGFKELLLS